jgi:signal transduction histidine kinase
MMTPVFWGAAAVLFWGIWSLSRATRACAGEFGLSWIAELLDHLDIGILVSRYDTQDILYVNKKMREEFDLSSDPSDSPEGAAPRFSRKILGEKIDSGVVYPDADGMEHRVWESRRLTDRKYYKNIETVVTWKDGGKARMYHSIDITRHRHAEIALESHERDLKNALESAQKANRVKSDFLSRISHEIRTPMNAIIGMTKIAQQSSDTLKIQNYLENIENSSRLLLGILNDVLDMSSIDAHQFKLQNAPFDFHKMLTSVCSSISADVAEKKQTVTTHVDESLRKMYIGDEMRLAQVVFNLMSNAVKFTPEGGRITLRAWQKEMDEKTGEATLEMSVEDTGIGISPENLAKIFTPFEQIEGGISRKFGGMGLGLVISKNIVELMGGTFAVHSKEKHGSLFAFTVKLLSAEEIPDETSAPAPEPDARPAPAEEAAEEKEIPAVDVDRGRLLPFFDVEEALIHLKGRNKLYVLLLQSYMKNDMIGKIENALLRQDLEDALQSAQALNSVAVSLGLRNLQFTVAFLVESLRNGIADKGILGKVKLSARETRRLIPNIIRHIEKGNTPS